MVAARISRQSAEVAAGAGAPAGVSRVQVESAAATNETSGAVAAQVTRVSAEVAGKRSATPSVTRMQVAVASDSNEATTAVSVQVSRLSVEVAINISPRVSTTRMSVVSAADANESTTAVAARVSRITAEAAARRGSAGVVVPLALSDDNEVFLHDWADALTLRSSYLTDVVIAPTGAESRRGLRLKPARSMDVVWRQSIEEFDAADLSRLERLYVFLRRLTGGRTAVPLYCDARMLTAAYAPGETVLSLDTSLGRWFVGARVAIVQLSIFGGYASHSFNTIADLDSSFVQLATPLAATVPAYSVIVPMLDCEVTLEAQMLLQASCLAEVTVTVDEIPGPSQLPATKSDNPEGFPQHAGYPILPVDPDWSEGVRRGRSRQGSEFTSGIARGVSPLASRARETYELPFVNERDEFWKVVQAFDTRRGRLRPFWHVDHESLWTAAQIDPNFVSIVVFGDLADASEELLDGQVGLVLRDGTFFVRDVVTFQQVASTYRMTVDPALPAGISASDVVRVARARLVRFDDDEMVERWTHAGLCETRLRIIETLENKDVEL